KEGGGSLVDSFGVELHLEGAPAVAAEADDGIDLVTVGVAPGRDVATQRLSANAKVSDRECLEMVAGGVEIGAHLGAADVERRRTERRVDEIPHRRRAQPGT